MAAPPNNLSNLKPQHTYYAVADVFNTALQQPLKREILRSDAYLELDPEAGTYQYSQASAYNIEGILSYKAGYTQVAGHPSSKVQGGFTTLATSVLEGLNVLDVVTADRVVAQISTVHSPFSEVEPDPVPSVTFLGTRFENLKIGGHPVTVHRSLGILGSKPVGKLTYFDDPGVKQRILTQRSDAASQGLPDWAVETYRADRPVVGADGALKCSLVHNVTDAPGDSFGNVIDLPHFGKIFLGELTLVKEKSPKPSAEYDAYRFDLTMIRLEMGCLAKGTGKFATASTNGKGSNGAGG